MKQTEDHLFIGDLIVFGATPLILDDKRTPSALAVGQANHTFRATGITAYLKNKGTLEAAQHIANHESPRKTKLYDRRQDEISLDEVEKILI
jgi:hypothetical protein